MLLHNFSVYPFIFYFGKISIFSFLYFSNKCHLLVYIIYTMKYINFSIEHPWIYLTTIKLSKEKYILSVYNLKKSQVIILCTDMDCYIFCDIPERKSWLKGIYGHSIKLYRGCDSAYRRQRAGNCIWGIIRQHSGIVRRCLLGIVFSAFKKMDFEAFSSMFYYAVYGLFFVFIP